MAPGFGDRYAITENFLNCFQDLYSITTSPKYRSFQFRLLHRKIFLNKILKLWGLSDTDRCSFCHDHYETIEHFFYDCREAQSFWLKLQTWFEALTDTEIMLSKEKILFNNFNASTEHFEVLNTMILIAKQFLFSQKCLGKHETSFYTYKDKVMKETIKFEFRKAQHSGQSQLKKFVKKWGILLPHTSIVFV